MTPDRRDPTQSTALSAATALLIALCFSSAVSAKQPNVLFIAVDDMNDWVSVLDSDIQAITPNIDRLAARGLNFTNAHTSGTYCAPARSAIFTGQFASTTGFYEYQPYHHLRPDLVPLQSSFKAGGYNTFGAGKLYNHSEGNVDLRDWTEFYVRTKHQRETGWPMSTWELGAPLPDQGIKSDANKGAYTQSGLRKWGILPNEKESEMADTIRTEWTISKLEETHDKPFFLGLGLYSPHLPNYAPQRYFDLYDRAKITLPIVPDDDLEDLPEPIRAKMKKRAKAFHHNYVKSDLLRECIHSYLASISYADAMIGRVLDALDASPYADNTIVVLWSDHGYHFGEKGHFGKKELWERTSNIPFVWRGPGIPRGKESNVTTSLIDMYPTFVEMCDLPPPAQQLAGTSLAALLTNPDQAENRLVYLPYTEPNAYAVISEEWRYLKYANESEELYHVTKDPNEWNNLADLPAHAAIKAKLQAVAPATFAAPGPQYKRSRDLVFEGETYRWEPKP